jgi:hypothetical protein
LAIESKKELTVPSIELALLSLGANISSSGRVPPVPSCDNMGSFVDLPLLDIAGLSKKVSQRRLYIRKELLQFWTALCGKDSIIITGPFGCGKSSLVWVWCLYYGTNNSVRWINLKDDNHVSIVDIVHGNYIKYTVSSRSYLEIIIATSTASVVVVCGMQKDIDGLLVYAKSKRIIFVSPQYSSLSRMQTGLPIFYMSGWLLNDYLDACKDVTFGNEIESKLDADSEALTTEQKVEAKYLIAGASAHWMFDLTTKEVLEKITNCLEHVNDDELQKGLVGLPSTVNFLFTRVKSTVIPVSECATRMFAKQCTDLFVAHVVDIARRSLWMEGNLAVWFFQLDFLHRLYKTSVSGQSELNTYTVKEDWAVGQIIEFFSVDDLMIKLNNFCIEGHAFDLDNCWLIPIRRLHQLHYDAIQILLDDNALRIVNLTLGQCGTFTCQYIIKVIEALRQVGVDIQYVDVVYVVPPENLRQFKVTRIEELTKEFLNLTDLKLHREWDRNCFRAVSSGRFK